MKRLFIIFFLLQQINLYSQNENSLYQIIPDSISSYGVLDGVQFFDRNAFKIKNRKERKKLVFFNKHLIDSGGLSFIDFKYSNKHLIGRSNYSTLYAISATGVEPLNFPLNDSSQIKEDLNDYYIVTGGTAIYQIDLGGPKKRLLVDLSSNICLKPPCYGLDDSESIEKIFAVNENKYLIQTCISSDVGPACEYTSYYLYDKLNGQVKNISSVIKDLTNENCRRYERSNVFVKSPDNKFMHWQTTKTHEACESDLRKSWLTDDALNYKSELLCMGSKESVSSLNPPSISGVAVSNDTILYYYLYSTLDKSKSVLVPYKFNPQLEISMFKAYSNTLLTKDALSGLGKYELGILRNLLFAKYNYDFTSEFYNAYFNLYCFYNNKEMRATRVKNINEKLTDIDRKNLQLIASAEKIAN